MSARLYGFGDPCPPTRAPVAPSGPMWLHEIKHDGYRLMVQRTAQGVRIRTRNGYDWSDRFPLIAGAASRLHAMSFVLDGEGVILRADGVSDFDRLHSRHHDGEVQLLSFDLLELDGTDLRQRRLRRARRRSRTCCAGRMLASNWSSTSRRTSAAPCSITPVGSAWRGSSASAATRPIDPAAAAHGSRSNKNPGAWPGLCLAA